MLTNESEDEWNVKSFYFSGTGPIEAFLNNYHNENRAILKSSDTTKWKISSRTLNSLNPDRRLIYIINSIASKV